MTSAIQPKVFFLVVKDNATKLQRLCDIVQQHFGKKERVQILVPSIEAANYIDNLLWRLPEESFLPHKISEGSSPEHVIITTQIRNLNQATILVNLNPNIPSNSHEYMIIYELLDLTHPAKEEASRKRQQAYQSLKISFEEI